MIETKIKAADNAGGIKCKCITIFGGFKRRYACLGELVGVIASSRKVYKQQTNEQKLAKLAKKLKKKRKIKAKKKRQPNMRPYLGLLVALKKRTKRPEGVYPKFDENRLFTFTEPTKFGPAGKTENIPNFIGTKATGPAPAELVKNKTIRARFKKAISVAGGIA